MSENADQVKTQIQQTRYTQTVLGKIKALLRKSTITGADAMDVVECLSFIDNMNHQAGSLLSQLRKGEPVAETPAEVSEVVQEA